MAKLRASATRWHSDDFPGWVEVSVRDARGRDHHIIEKVPVVTTTDIGADSSFPIGFWIEAEIESVDDGSVVMTLPYGMETTEGERSLAVVPADVDQARYEACRWHFDHYPHYLGRRRHFRDYATYIRDRHGPLRVASPRIPGWL